MPVPTDFAGLRLWLKADTGVFSDAGVTPAVNNDPVQQWNDQSGGTRNSTQAVATNKPTWIASAINGLPAIRFDGVDNFMNLPALTLTDFIANNAFTIFAVAKINAIDTDAANTYENDAIIADDGELWGLHLKSTGPIACLYNWDGTDDKSQATIDLASTWILQGRHEGGSLFLKANGGAEDTDASGNTLAVTNPVFIGKNGSATPAYASMDLTELVIYNVALSAANRSAVEDYLTDKWTPADGGITSFRSIARPVARSIARRVSERFPGG